eukprot:3949992-Amphidinium_carterae.2
MEDVMHDSDDETVEWLLPKGSRSLLHVRHPSREDGQAYCQRAPFVWGYESGRGLTPRLKADRIKMSRPCSRCNS